MDGDSLTRMGLTLALLLGIPGLLLVALRRFGLRLPGQPDGGARLGIVSRLPIDARHSLLLVRRDTREQLILIGPAGATILEAEVTLSEADQQERKAQAQKRDALAAANRDALRRASAGVAQQMVTLIGTLRQAGGKRFHQLVEQERAPAPAPARKPRPQRTRRRRAEAA